jgi:hypothetical protein
MRGVTVLAGRLRRAPRREAGRETLSSLLAPPARHRLEETPTRHARQLVGPAWRPAPAPETRPQPVLRDPLPPQDDGTRTVAERVAAGLRNLDLAAIDEAQRAGITYAQACAARGRTPLGDAAARNFRAEVRPVRRHGEAVRRQAQALAYPPFRITVAAGEGAYAEVMRHADRITGTQGSGVFRPAIAAGGAA